MAGLGVAGLGGAARRGAAAHVFVDSVDAPVLDEVDRHHLDRVLRLRPGQSVSVSDGAGSWRLCAYTGAGRVDPVADVAFEPRVEPAITVGFALTKGDKPEWAVQKLTEVGVDVVAPLLSARSVVRWEPDKAARNSERLGRVAREAAMQSRRVWLPEVRPVVPFAEAVAGAGAVAGGVAAAPPALAEPGGGALSLDHPTVFVGPEGGWSGEELDLGLANVSVGSTILRAETATLAVGIVLTAVRGGFVGIHDE
jgi:16S rRNA (uracil1498-N3)-methyltransferase